MKQELYLFTYLYQAQSIKSLRRYTNEISAPEAQYVSLYLLQKLSISTAHLIVSRLVSVDYQYRLEVTPPDTSAQV